MTSQIHESLILDGQTVGMAFCPPLPTEHPRIIRVDTKDVWRNDPRAFASSCWRNYRGTWEIREGRLYLAGLRGIYRMIGDEPIFADWFNGTLRIPQGAMQHYVHAGFASICEYDMLIKIKRGVVVSSRTRENRGRHFYSGWRGWLSLMGLGR